jgi:hypothetical protein
MVSPNSHGEYYLDLLLSVIEQDPLGATSKKSLMRDLRTVCDRFEHEGLSFLTKTLPLLGKALDQGLLSSIFCVPREFKKAHSCTGIPAFMQAYFKMVFKDDGSLLEKPDVNAIKHLRQVCFMLYKLEIPYSRKQEESVITSFVQAERELELGSDAQTTACIAAASYIVRELFRDFDHREILPRHGPGAVATGEKLEGKWDFSRLFRGIHQVYPYYEYYLVGWGKELIDRLDWYRSLQRCDSGVAKVVLVPKDSRGPRLISCEPLEYQWIQQGLGRKLVAHLETHHLTAGRINFTDQEINRQLALESSQTQEYATLDLKEASDRVSVELVERLFAHCEGLQKALLGTRTTATRLPNGSTLALKKFAPMGSALCFPVEAVVFWVMSVAAISRETRLRPQEVGRRVFVYGDDIIVPVEWASTVMHALESVALKVNRSKSCTTGYFRESCGMDAYKGTCITPIRVRKPWLGERRGSHYASYIAFANQMEKAGYTKCSDSVWASLTKLYGFIPYGTSTSGFPCRVVSSPRRAEVLNRGQVRWRWNAAFQRIEYRVRYLKSKVENSLIDGWTRLLRDLVTPALDDPTHVVHPKSTQIKLGWRPV